CVGEHDALITEAGDAASALVKHEGWIRCLRTEESLRQAIANARRLDKYGVDYAVLTGAQLRELEPQIGQDHRGSPFPRLADLVRPRHADKSLRRSIHAQGRALRKGRCMPSR